MINATLRLAMRVFQPDSVKHMEAEGVFNFTDSTAEAEANKAFMQVEDRGSDVTIFAFSGVDVLYAGLARFEFQKIFTEIGQDYNLVFFRDVNRTAYHKTPDGQPGGLEFHKSEVLKIRDKLGAKYNVAIGSSSGGSAALYMAVHGNMDFALAFGPLVAYEPYTNLGHCIRTLFDFRKLLREPAAYFELIVVTIAALTIVRKLVREVGPENLADPLGDYEAASPRPRMTLLHGRHCVPDTYFASILGQYPEVKVIPLDTGRHNSPAYLKKRGELATVIAREFREAFASLEGAPAVQEAGGGG